MTDDMFAMPEQGGSGGTRKRFLTNAKPESHTRKRINLPFRQAQTIKFLLTLMWLLETKCALNAFPLF